MSVSPWHKVEGKNNIKKVSIEVGTSEGNPVYKLRTGPLRVSRNKSKAVVRDLLPIKDKLPKMMELMRQGYSPNLSASYCGFRWLDWRYSLVHCEEFMVAYEDYRERTKRKGLR